MRNIKKFMAVALATVMTMGLAACGSSSETGSTGSTGSTGGSTASAGGDTVSLNMWAIDYNGQSTDDAVVKQVADAMNDRLAELGSKARINLTVKPEGEYWDNANLAFASGEIDILWTASWAPTIGSTALVNNKYVYDITDLLPGTTLYNCMPEWFWSVSRYAGRDYFIPVYKEGAEGYMIKVLSSSADKIGGVDNAAIEGKANIYERLKALEPYLAKAKDAGIKYPFVFAGTPMFYRFYMDSFDFVDGGAMAILGVDQAKDEMVNPTQTADYEKYCTLMAEWAANGYIDAAAEVGGQTDASTTQTSDWLFNWWTRVPNNNESIGRDANQDETFIAVTDSWGKSLSSIGSCYAISVKCSEEKAKAAIDFLGFLETDNKLADLYTFGIEGVTYNLQDGKIERDTDPAMQSGSSKYRRDPWCSTSVQALSLQVGEPDDKVELYVSFNNAAKATKSAGFVFDNTPVADAYTASVAVFNEMGKSLELGAIPADQVAAKIAEMQTALDNAGYQDVLAEAQRQYNEWKKTR